MTNYSELDMHILNIVQNNDILEQTDLKTSLEKRGHDIPQASLSRRLKKLLIAKVNGRYQIVDHNQFQSLPMVLNIKVSDFGGIVLHTHPGNANTIGYFLDNTYVSYTAKDNKQNSPILGTIAGDDTVFIITKNKAATKEVLKLLKSHFPYLGEGDD